MPLTIATVMSFKDRACDFLANPAVVLASLPDPRVLLPIASAIKDQSEDEIAKTLTADAYVALQQEVEREILRFFPKSKQEIITQFRDAIANELNENDRSKLKSYDATHPTPPGGQESGSPPESSDSTQDPSTSETSKPCESPTNEPNGTASASSEPGSSTANPANEPSVLPTSTPSSDAHQSNASDY